MRWNLKRLTALIAMIYGLATLVTAAWAFYLEQNWYRDGWKDSAAIEAEVTRMIRQSGIDPLLPTMLQRMNATMGWSASYVTEAGGSDPVILTSTSPRLADHTWNELDQSFRMSDYYWRGSLGRTYEGPDGKRYAIWALLDRKSIAWPLLNQIALVTAGAAWLAIAAWLALDVRDRGAGPVTAWFLLGLLTGPAGVAIWLVARPIRSAVAVCPGCGHHAPAEAGFCPRCGFALQAICPDCKTPVQLDWTYCTRCGAPLDEVPAAIERGEGA
ncbi:MAG TPA: zinc ribbon domain-containing protein [Symbiobacteriaceae bacterium]|nr:zinc ribbon domain-containing protein [Symbiobacteriaceae bacterium]